MKGKIENCVTLKRYFYPMRKSNWGNCGDFYYLGTKFWKLRKTVKFSQIFLEFPKWLVHMMFIIIFIRSFTSIIVNLSITFKTFHHPQWPLMKNFKGVAKIFHSTSYSSFSGVSLKFFNSSPFCHRKKYFFSSIKIIHSHIIREGETCWHKLFHLKWSSSFA